MPWKEYNAMDERLRFVARLLDGEKMTPLCRSFGISRKTGYKIFERYKYIGVEGLTDRSRRPYRQRPRGLARGGLDTFHHCGGGGSDAAAEPRRHAADLAQRRRRRKLVESEILSDPAADERASQHRVRREVDPGEVPGATGA